jgi:hypothetical protein
MSYLQLLLKDPEVSSTPPITAPGTDYSITPELLSGALNFLQEPYSQLLLVGPEFPPPSFLHLLFLGPECSPISNHGL